MRHSFCLVFFAAFCALADTQTQTDTQTDGTSTATATATGNSSQSVAIGDIGVDGGRKEWRDPNQSGDILGLGSLPANAGLQTGFFDRMVSQLWSGASSLHGQLQSLISGVLASMGWSFGTPAQMTAHFFDVCDPDGIAPRNSALAMVNILTYFGIFGLIIPLLKIVAPVVVGAIETAINAVGHAINAIIPG